jgi:hypothetical protein
MSCHWRTTGACFATRGPAIVRLPSRHEFASVPLPKGGDPSKMLHREAKQLREVLVPVRVPVHGGSRKTDPPRKLAHRRKPNRNRKRKFGKSREYCLIDRTAFHIWTFGSSGFLSAGKLSAASIRASEHPSIRASEHIWSPSSMPQHPSHVCVQDRRELHREPSLSLGYRGQLASSPSGD